MDNISFNTPDNTWSNYGLAEYPIAVNGNKIDKKAIMRNGELVAITSDKYVLLPNEEALKQANLIAEHARLIPFKTAQ
jgi:hypothetical protein